MSAGGYMHNLALPNAGQAPLGDGFVAERTPFLENMDRHGEGEIAHRDVHSAISNFVFWHLFNKRRQATRQISSPASRTEQGRKGRGISLTVNRLTAFNDDPGNPPEGA